MSQPVTLEKPQPVSRIALWAWRLLQVAILLVPVVQLHQAVRRYRVNTLFLDDWVYVPLYEKAAKGLLTWHDLYAGYLEHRIPIPKLIAILGVLFTKGDVTTQCWTVWAVLVLCWLGVGLMLWRVFRDWDRLWLPWALSGGILCSTLHWQNLLWPSNHVLAMPGVFLVLALLCLGAPRLRFWPRLLSVFFFTWCAMHSCASGLSLAGIMPVVVLCGYGTADWRERRKFLLWLCGGLAVSCAIYLHDLKSEVEPAFAYGQENGADTLKHDIGTLFQNPHNILPFFTAQLGANLSRGLNADRQDTPLIFGSLLLAVFLLLAVWAWAGRKEGRLARAAPFLGLGSYSLGAAALITLGRAWASPYIAGALNNRYSSISAMLIVAIVCLAALWLHEVRLRGAAASLIERRIAPAVPVAAGLLGMALIAVWLHGHSMMRAWQEARLRGAVDLHFSQVLGLSGHGDHPGLRMNVVAAATGMKILDELGYLDHPLAKERTLQGFKLRENLPQNLCAIRERFITKNRTIISGHALLKSSGRPPDGIALTARGSDPSNRDPQLLTINYVDEPPVWADTHYTKDFHFILSKTSRPARYGRWRIEIPNTQIPPGRQRLELWALDYKDMTRHRIGSFFVGQDAVEAREVEANAQ